jgi:nicotinamidase-related amidase
MTPTPPVLLVIDVQAAFDDASWGTRNNPDFEARLTELLAAWRAASLPLVHVRHESAEADGLFERGTPAFEFKAIARPLPHEPVIDKRVNSAFIGTDLEQRLHNLGDPPLVICGLTTDHCCSTTARMSQNLGFETWFVSDATATFGRELDGTYFEPELIHETALASLNGEFADVMSTAEAISRATKRG